MHVGLTPLLAAALSYANRGWPVLPIRPESKVPFGALARHGLQNATTDPGTIRQWWTAAPTANVGIRTGVISGLVVLDVDPRRWGDEALRELEHQHGKIPETVEVLTGGGGRHIFFTHPGPAAVIRNAAGLAGLPGLDLRGDGGYVVAPPSLHASGRTYEWEASSHPDQVPIAPMPGWLLALVQPRATTVGPPPLQDAIGDGNRNSTLASLAGVMRHRGMTVEAIRAALLAENVRRCVPPLPPAEVERIATSIGRYDPGSNGIRGGKSRASAVLELVDAELFHAPDGDPFAAVTVGDHRETWALRSKGFRRWLARRYYGHTGAVPGAQSLQDAIGVLEGRAIYEGPERPVFVRLARDGETVYLDLGTDRWEAVRITAEGWVMVADPPVKFRRSRGMTALPVPIRGGQLDELRAFVNVATEADWVLLAGWLVGAFSPTGPYPVLALHGEQGSAKSTTARLLRALIDPNASPLRAEPKDVRDLMIAASNAWCLAFDNLSSLAPWLSDALCRLSTGGGFATRELHTDADEVLFDAQRPVILNGITEVASHSDLLDRVLTLELPPIPDTLRQTEAQVWGAFETARPRVLGALCEAVAVALQRRATVTLSALPRMADYAVWVTAAEPALGWSTGTFLEAYHGNRAAAHDVALDASLLAAEVRALLATQASWTGTAADLLALLGERANLMTVRQKSWPGTPRALGGALRQLAPNLRATGIVVEFSREPTGARRRIIALRTDPAATVSTVSTVRTISDSSTGSARPGVPGDGGDGGDPKSRRHPAPASPDDPSAKTLGAQTSDEAGTGQPDGRAD